MDAVAKTTLSPIFWTTGKSLASSSLIRNIEKLKTMSMMLLNDNVPLPAVLLLARNNA